MSKVIIAYVPALHQGYLNFFRRYQDSDLYILGKDLVCSFPRMDRDIRAMSAAEMREAINVLNVFKNVYIADEESLKKLETKEIVMPDEDINHEIANRYFSKQNIEFVPTFLRWDKLASIKKYNVYPDTEVSEKKFDKDVISRAFKEAQRSTDWWRQVGAIVFKGDREIGKTHNKHVPVETNPYEFGDPRSNFDAGERIDLSTVLHAEAGLIADAAKKGESLEGASIYVTTFPCPNCAKLIAASGIKKVYYNEGYSLLDAESILKESNVEIIRVEKENTSQ